MRPGRQKSLSSSTTGQPGDLAQTGRERRLASGTWADDDDPLHASHAASPAWAALDQLGRAVLVMSLIIALIGRQEARPPERERGRAGGDIVTIDQGTTAGPFRAGRRW